MQAMITAFRKLLGREDGTPKRSMGLAGAYFAAAEKRVQSLDEDRDAKVLPVDVPREFAQNRDAAQAAKTVVVGPPPEAVTDDRAKGQRARHEVKAVNFDFGPGLPKNALGGHQMEALLRQLDKPVAH